MLKKSEDKRSPQACQRQAAKDRVILLLLVLCSPLLLPFPPPAWQCIAGCVTTEVALPPTQSEEEFRQAALQQAQQQYNLQYGDSGWMVGQKEIVAETGAASLLMRVNTQSCARLPLSARPGEKRGRVKLLGTTCMLVGSVAVCFKYGALVVRNSVWSLVLCQGEQD